MVYFRFSQHSSTAARMLVGRSILGLILFALAGCGSDSDGSAIDMGASAATGGLLNMCSDSAPGCLTETTQQDGVIIRSCQEFFMPAQAVLTQASCDELATNPNETATFYQGGCPKGADYLGHCIRSQMLGTRSLLGNQHFYEIQNQEPAVTTMTHQGLRDQCQSVSMGMVSIEMAWCAGSIQ